MKRTGLVGNFSWDDCPYRSHELKDGGCAIEQGKQSLSFRPGVDANEVICESFELKEGM